MHGPEPRGPPQHSVRPGERPVPKRRAVLSSVHVGAGPQSIERHDKRRELSEEGNLRGAPLAEVVLPAVENVYVKANASTKCVHKCKQDNSIRALGDTQARSEDNEHIQQTIDKAAKRTGRSAQHVSPEVACTIVPEHSTGGES